MLENNPLLASYDLPPFSTVRAEHLVPAIEVIIADSRVEVTRIIVSQRPYPTWDDLVLAMDEVHARLDGAVHVIKILSGVNTQQAWIEAAGSCFEQITAYKELLGQNLELYELYLTLSKSKVAALFDKARKAVLNKILREYRLSGIRLTTEQQQRLRELNRHISQQENEFRSRLQQANTAWTKHIDDESLLVGLPEEAKLRMANAAQQKSLQGWLVNVGNDQFREVMLYASHRPLREEVWVAYHSRASNQGQPGDPLNNDDVLRLLLGYRHEKARLLGFENFSQLSLEEQIVESTDQVSAFLRKELDDQRSTFALETQQLQDLTAQEGITRLEPWDYEYLAEKVRRAKGGSQEDLRQYFPLDTVISRLCDFTSRLFGVELVERSDFDSWHADVRLFEVREHQEPIGYLFVDPYRRELGGPLGETLSLRNRRITAEGRPRLPIAVLRSKFTAGKGDKPCLLDHQQLRILLHEFGHCLQQLLTGEEYREISGITALGYGSAEFVSQVFEQWCFSEQFLIWISSHYQSAESIPASLVTRLIASVKTQTSWAAAGLLLIMLFDFEVHRTYGDGRSTQEVFDSLNAEIGHLQWPHNVRPVNSGDFIASNYGARTYSYKWSSVFAIKAFEQFVRKGVFDPTTGRAFREAFITRGGSRLLAKSLEVFLPRPDTGSPLPLTSALTLVVPPLHHSNGTQPYALLVNQLSASQQSMVRLSEAIPQPTEVAKKFLNDWFRKTFPALADNVTVEALSLRTLREDLIPLSERSSADPAFKRTVVDTMALDTLFWRAVGGRLNTRELFLDLDKVEIVQETDGATQVPAVLNSSNAKANFEALLLGHVWKSYTLQLERALDEYWNNPEDFSLWRNVSDWLADELRTQLMVQANYLQLDATLSLQMHKAVTDYALSAPDAVSRAQMPDHIRPGVYALEQTPPGWAMSVPVQGCIVLTQRDNTEDPGAAVLWRTGEPLEVFDSVELLKASLQNSGEVEGEVHIEAIQENFLSRQIQGLREAQKASVGHALREGMQEGETISDWVTRLEVAQDIAKSVDLVWPLTALELQVSQNNTNRWLRAKHYVTGKDRLAWWAALKDWQKVIASTTSFAPDPVTLATTEAIRDWTRVELTRLIKEKYPPADDPEKVYLSIKNTILDPHAPSGNSPFGSGLVLRREKGFFYDRRSMIDWAISNLTPQESNALDHFEEGPLSYAAICEVIEIANVGGRFIPWLSTAGRQKQAEWMSLKGKQIRVEVWAAHISGHLMYDRDNIGLNMALAALDSPQPAGRRKVNDHDVDVYQLKWGHSVLRDVLAFGVKTLAGRPSLTLYTPDAPDGKVLRDVDADTVQELLVKVAVTLTSTQEMTLWLISRLPLSEQSNHIESMKPASEELTTNEQIKLVTQSIFSWIKLRAPQSFSASVSLLAVEGDFLNVLHETQMAHALNAADTLTVSNAERDSKAAQQGRLNAAGLLSGMLSMFPASRLGGMLGRAIIPAMISGAAVSAIQDEGGSFSQWVSDFISGLGEVIAEGGEDLIMSRAGRPKNKSRTTLSTLPHIQDPQMKPFQVKGVQEKGLERKERNLYRDAGGQEYLKQGTKFYKTAMQGGERIIYSPNNRADHRTVTWESDKWSLVPRARLLGGGPVVSLFRPPETPEQQRFNALLEGFLIAPSRQPPEQVRLAREIISSMPDELATRILRETMEAAGVSSIPAYRLHISSPSLGQAEFNQRKNRHSALLYKCQLWKLIHTHIKYFEEGHPDMKLTTAQIIKIFDTAFPFKSKLVSDSGQVSLDMVRIVDPFTGAIYVAITPARGREKSAMSKMLNEMGDMFAVIETASEANLRKLLPGDGPEAVQAREDYMSIPENAERHQKELHEAIKEDRRARNKPGLLTEIRSKNIPYVVISKGTSQHATRLTTGEDINSFTRSLPRYTETFEIEAVTKTTSSKVVSIPSTDTDTAVPSQTLPAKDTFAVGVSPLAETQMSYNNFPESARSKMTEIMDDIRVGRATTKRINGYYWYDMPQLTPGGGRGVWRAAFERRGNTWELQGFYDYHQNRPAVLWGD